MISEDTGGREPVRGRWPTPTPRQQRDQDRTWSKYELRGRSQQTRSAAHDDRPKRYDINTIEEFLVDSKAECGQLNQAHVARNNQESPAIADKHARRESMPKIAQIRRAYNVVADNTGLYSYI